MRCDDVFLADGTADMLSSGMAKSSGIFGEYLRGASEYFVIARISVNDIKTMRVETMILAYVVLLRCLDRNTKQMKDLNSVLRDLGRNFRESN